MIEGQYQNSTIANQTETPLGLRNVKMPTLAEAIDHQIADLENRIAGLKATKEKLGEPGGILNIPLNDLRNAMNY